MVLSNPHFRAKPDFSLLYIVGAGGFGREVAWLAEQSWGGAVEKTFLVDKEEYLVPSVAGMKVSLLTDAGPGGNARYIVAIGDPVHRRRVVPLCDRQGLAPTVLTHPRAEMSHGIGIGVGTIICAGTVATTDIVIGRHVHINLGCTIGHDVRVGDFSTLSPGVHVSGNVHIGKGVFVGTGASIIDGKDGEPLVVGDGAVIAAGACVIRSVEPGAMVAGVPAVRKR